MNQRDINVKADLIMKIFKTKNSKHKTAKIIQENICSLSVEEIKGLRNMK